MYADPILVRIDLEDWEWDMLDAEAAAVGLHSSAFIRSLIVEEAVLVLSDMDGVSLPWDSQWKSH